MEGLDSVYKYERLYGMCFACGRVGHEEEGCKSVDLNVRLILY